MNGGVGRSPFVHTTFSETLPATIYAITSTISNNGDNGADPNKLVKVTDLISATQLTTNGKLDNFETIRSARAGEAFRGVALAPEDDGFFFGPGFPFPGKF